MAMRKLIAFAFSICLGVACVAIVQNPAAQPSPTTPAGSTTASDVGAPSGTARPGDVDSVEHIIAAVYDVISGPAGPRDWDRFRSLYHPGARMIPSRRDDKGTVSARVSSPDEYATRSRTSFPKRGSSKIQCPTAWNRGTTSRMCGAPMSRATPKEKNRSRAASTASSCLTTAAGGGSSPSTGKVKIKRIRCRRNT